ncbi:hypothetical protein MHL31_05195 [Lutibacter sp. A80]|uniref:hypothetical protein n=1 Tax=Lutibacter sp. A80 TaxID=2918453 RepID=UPI001F0593EC|nr:hypothetical protein [Lutibacter sp. A80]UMB61601.1 hypothetical protein MHL31_05195 [Lutibacter sp. A80]
MSTGLYVEEKEIGLIGTHEISVENFHIESLKFYLTNVKVSNIDYQLLNFMTYNNQVIPNVKSDSMLTYQNCKFIKRLG